MQLSNSDPSIEYGGRQPQRERAAAYVLRKIADRRGMLQQTLNKLGMLSTSHSSAVIDQKHLRDALPHDFLTTVLSATGMPEEDLERPLLEQLDRVAQFAKSDGVSSNENVKAAEYLIRSGREALFSR